MIKKEKLTELKGATINVSLLPLPSQVVIDQDKCPRKDSNGHCVVNNKYVCEYFRGIRVTSERPDIILCAYPVEQKK